LIGSEIAPELSEMNMMKKMNRLITKNHAKKISTKIAVNAWQKLQRGSAAKISVKKFADRQNHSPVAETSTA